MRIRTEDGRTVVEVTNKYLRILELLPNHQRAAALTRMRQNRSLKHLSFKHLKKMKRRHGSQRIATILDGRAK